MFKGVYRGIPQYQYHLGIDPNGQDKFVDMKKINNFNMAFFGASGTGKTYSVRRMVENLWLGNVTVVIPDTQGDLGFDGGYENLTREAFAQEDFDYQHGTVCINCLDITVEGKGGGYYPAVQRALRAITYFHPQIGIRQKAVLIKVLDETYKRYGIHRSEQKTWGLSPPTIDDALHTVDNFMKEAVSGVPASIFEECYSLKKKIERAKKQVDSDYSLASHSGTSAAQAKAERTETDYEEAVEEIKERVAELVEREVRGDNIEVAQKTDINALMGVELVLRGMADSRLFSGHKSFSARKGKVNVLDIHGLGDNDQQAIFFLLLGRLFSDAIISCKELNAGIPRLMCVFDEAKLYKSVCEDSMSPFPRIVTEGRKFGMGTLIGAQSTNQISKEILGNIALSFILPLPRSEWRGAKQVFGLDESMMGAIRPKSDGYIAFNGDEPSPCHLWQYDKTAWSRELRQANSK